MLLPGKSHIGLTSTDPVLLDKAFTGVYSAWAAIIAVLSLQAHPNPNPHLLAVQIHSTPPTLPHIVSQFARTIALGAAIGDFAFKMINGKEVDMVEQLHSPPP